MISATQIIQSLLCDKLLPARNLTDVTGHIANLDIEWDGLDTRYSSAMVAPISWR